MDTIFIVIMIASSILAGCNKKVGSYGFGVTSPGGSHNVKIAFTDGSSWPIGNVQNMSTIAGLPGPMPDTADVSWTDDKGTDHKQHLQITPLPPPTFSSTAGTGPNAERIVYFVIQPDNTVKLMYHDPRFTH